MSTGIGLVDRLRRPEYTGENRCLPCTVANLVVAAALAAVAWLYVPSGAAPTLALAVLLASVAVIYLRGYLVPGTPWFTRTYFPDPLLRAFEKDTRASPGPTDGGRVDDDFDVESVLAEAGATEECADVDDLCLTAGFREAWRAEIEAVRASDARFGELVAALDDGLAVEERGELVVARRDGGIVGRWESEAAYVADIAAAGLLEERFPAWSGFGLRERGALLEGLRLFVERCPSCDGPVTFDEEVVRSCCRSRDVVAVTCDDCGARLFEAEVDDDA